MLRLLMIADDFTGALDTGVQLAAHGIPTQVVVGQADLSACSSTVLVVDTETRHLPAAKAAKAVEELTRSAVENGVGCIYKKTDSALRGNIGAELAALLKASGARNLPFLPAFPQIGRTTEKGVHYIKGVPVNESPFGIDPFEPVRCAEVTKLIHLQTDVPAQSRQRTRPAFWCMTPPPPQTLKPPDSSCSRMERPRCWQAAQALPPFCRSCWGFRTAAWSRPRSWIPGCWCSAAA